jgi:small conductance mechanosensitive channel
MESELLQRLGAAGAVLLATVVVARIVDRALARHFTPSPETLTVYRVIRRSALAIVATVGILSALLVIPEVQAVAGAVLASSAVVALVVGLAAQSTLSNFVAGIFVAFTQPLRLGDSVSVAGATGTVQRIGLTYTVIRAADGARFYVPNTKLASDTIRNATIGSAEYRAAVSVTVPLATDLDRVLDLLADVARSLPQTVTDREVKAHVSQLEAATAVVTVEAWARTPAEAAELEVSLRRAALERLRAEGAIA